MELAQRKQILEVCGIIRMILGIVQLVGLTAGYFLLEWIVRYPSEVSVYLINQELIALTYLAILIRSCFHMATGIGMARTKEWTIVWLQYGWPILMMVTLGLSFALGGDLAEAGYVTKVFDIISWPKVLFYFAVIIFDFIFVVRSIEQINISRENLSDRGLKLSGGKLTVILFVTVLSFSVLMFLGKPIKQGFHQGYYKMKGSRSHVGKQVKVVRSKDHTTEQITTSLEHLKGTVSKMAEEEPLKDPVFQRSKVQPMLIEENKKAFRGKRTVIAQEKGEVQKGLAYRRMIGFIGGFLLIASFFIQILEILQSKNAGHVSLAGFALLAMGFLLWLVYGAASQLVEISLVSLACFVLCTSIILLKFKYEND